MPRNFFATVIKSLLQRMGFLKAIDYDKDADWEIPGKPERGR